MVVFPKKKNNNNNNNNNDNNDKDSQDDDKNVEKMDFEETGTKGKGKGVQKMPLATFQKTDAKTASNPPPSNVGGGASSSSGSGSNVGVPDVPAIIPLPTPDIEGGSSYKPPSPLVNPDVSTSSTPPVINTTPAQAATPASAPSTSTTSATTPAPQATTTTTIGPASSSAAASSSSSSKTTTPPTQSVIPSTAAASTNPPEKTGLGGGSGSSSQAPTINPGATFSTQPVFKNLAPKVKLLSDQVKKLSEDFEAHIKKAGNTKKFTQTEKTISDNIKTYWNALQKIGKGFIDLAQSTDVIVNNVFAEKSDKDVIKLEKEIHDLETKFEKYKKLPLSESFKYSLESATTALPETSAGGDIVIEENKPKSLLISATSKSNIPLSSTVPATTSSNPPPSSIIFTSSSSPSSSSSILMPSATQPKITVSPASSTVSPGQFTEALEDLYLISEEVEALEDRAAIENEEFRLQQIAEEEEEKEKEEEKNAMINKKKKKYNNVLNDIDFFGYDIDQLESDVLFNRTKEFAKTAFEEKIEVSVNEIRAFFQETHNSLTRELDFILRTKDDDAVANFYESIEEKIYEIKEGIAKRKEEIIRFKNRYWNVYNNLQGDFADKLHDKLPILDTSSNDHIMLYDEIKSMLSLIYYHNENFSVSGNTKNDTVKVKEGKRRLSLYEKYCVTSFFQRILVEVLSLDKWSEYLNVLVGVYDDNEIDACIKALKKITTTKKSEQLEKVEKIELKINHQYYDNAIYNTKVGEDAVINYADCTLTGKGIDGFVADNKKESNAEYIFDITNINVENLGWYISDVVEKVKENFRKTDINQRVLIYEGIFGKLYVSLIKNERHECLGELLNINSQIVTKPFSIQLLSNRLFGDKYFSTDTSRMYLKAHYKHIMRDFFKRRIGNVKMEINQKDLMFFYNYLLFSFCDLVDVKSQFVIDLYSEHAVFSYDVFLFIVIACCLRVKCFNSYYQKRLLAFGGVNVCYMFDDNSANTLKNACKEYATNVDPILHYYEFDLINSKISNSDKDRINDMLSVIKNDGDGDECTDFKVGVYCHGNRICFPCDENSVKLINEKYTLY